MGTDPNDFTYNAYMCECRDKFSEVTETKWFYDPVKDPPLSPIKYTPDRW